VAALKPPQADPAVLQASYKCHILFICLSYKRLIVAR
jgi:hypothetical protein